MKPLTVALLGLGVVAAGGALYLYTRRKPAAPVGSSAVGVALPSGMPAGKANTTTPTLGNVARGVEDKIGKALGLPVAPSKIGDLAQSAPTALKVAVLPIGITAVAQDVIDDPEGAARAVAGSVTGLFTGSNALQDAIQDAKDRAAAKAAGYGDDVNAYRHATVTKGLRAAFSAGGWAKSA